MNLDKLFATLKVEEGTGPYRRGRFYPYRDSRGFLTIGYGYNLDANGISRELAELLLKEKVDEVLAGLRLFVPWFADLDDVRQRVLTDMAYNLGVEGLLKWPIFLGQVQRGQYIDAARNMETAHPWVDQVGTRADTLVRMMESGSDA